MSERVRKINELVREEAGRAIAENISPDNFITVTAVESSPDLKKATIWVSIMTDEKKAVDELESKKSVIQHSITSKMATKYTPKIEFKVDHSQAYVENIDRLLKGDDSNQN